MTFMQQSLNFYSYQSGCRVHNFVAKMPCLSRKTTKFISINEKSGVQTIISTQLDNYFSYEKFPITDKKNIKFMTFFVSESHTRFLNVYGALSTRNKIFMTYLGVA